MIVAALVAGYLLSLAVVDGLARQQMGMQLLRQGQISSALGEMADPHANARTRAIDRLANVAADQGAGDDLTDPFVAALLKHGINEVWSVAGQQHLAFDVTDDGMTAAVARPDGDVDVIDRVTNESERLRVNAEQPADFRPVVPWGQLSGCSEWVAQRCVQ